MKKIISFLLIVATVITGLVMTVPAAAAEEEETPKYETATKDALKNAYATAEAKVAAEMAAGYTFLYAQNSGFELYCNKYTGEVYLRNRQTNRFLMTNPLSSAASGGRQTDLLSQIWLSYTPVENLGAAPIEYTSFQWAAQKGQISVGKIKNGIRVEYIMGDTISRYLVPEAATKADFTNTVIIPIQQAIVETMTSLATTFKSFVDASNPNYDFAEYTGEWGNAADFKAYMTALGKAKLTGNTIKVDAAYRETVAMAASQLMLDYKTARTKANSDAALKEAMIEDLVNFGLLSPGETILPSLAIQSWVTNFYLDYNTIIAKYSLIDPNTVEVTDALLEKYPILGVTDPATGLKTPVYTLNAGQTQKEKRDLQSMFSKWLPEYTMDIMLEQEEKTGYVVEVETNPVFRCAIEYVLDDTGMSYSLPSNSIVYDESLYRLKEISILKYLGAGLAEQEGYVFYPDGSGALVYNEEISGAANMSSKIYGYDYAYRTITGKLAQPTRLPVYGASNTTFQGTDGYFAIITEGESLVTINLRRDVTNKYVTVYQSFEPRPIDAYTTPDMSDSIMILSDTKYTGNYTTKIVMLNDPATHSGYRADYVGMAAAYRDYLINIAKTLDELTDEEVKARLPLIIESFGITTTVKKVLSFPIEVDVPLTKFSDIITMYKGGEDENGDPIEGLLERGISNVKFKLTGFYNGGMNGKYPTKLKLLKAVGGKKGFNNLLSYIETQEENGAEVFLNVDFVNSYQSSYGNGFSLKKNVARAMDNRYATKQMYDTVYQGFVQNFVFCVSADRIHSLFKKFDKYFSKYDADAISLDYMAEDLSSNFDKQNSLNREEAKFEIQNALAKISDKYNTVLSTGGNAYAFPYVDYLTNVPTDSSRCIYASRTVPFYGMVLHGCLQYTGTAINESGNPEYEILRAIENGASLYFILCFRNTNLMKEDEDLVKHYSAEYLLWKDDLVKYYDILDYAIGDLQTWQIVDHKFLIAERVLSAEEIARDEATVESEYLSLLYADLEAALTKKTAFLRMLYELGIEYNAAADEAAKQKLLDDFAPKLMNLNYDSEAVAWVEAKIEADSSLTWGTALKALIDEGTLSFAAGQRIKVTIDTEAILADAEDKLMIDLSDEFIAAVNAFAASNTATDGTLSVNISGVADYKKRAARAYLTESEADDDRYSLTEYSVDDGSVVMVSYSNGTETVRFLLNFSIFAVKVKLGGTVYELDKFDFVRLDARADNVTDPRNNEGA